MIQIGFKTDQGRIRSINEDALFVMHKENIYLIADGVGGHNAGEMASRTAVQEIVDFIAQNPLNKTWEDDTIKAYYSTCFKKANDSVNQLSQLYPDCKGMATTALLLYVSDNRGVLVNVGDSRAYLVRGHSITQLTEDHTIVNQMLKEGTITKQEADGHPMNNMITRALGGEESLKPDFFQLELFKKDILLLCTDGLYSEVTETEILEVLISSNTMQTASNRLVECANNNQGKDNITVICVRL
jgi:serine/threonine protein phosphatase PrpC